MPRMTNTTCWRRQDPEIVASIKGLYATTILAVDVEHGVLGQRSLLVENGKISVRAPPSSATADSPDPRHHDE
jgi:hypothetical protein